jgi:hypothetical protein
VQPESVEVDVGPSEPVDLRAPQPGVERARVRHLVVRLEHDRQRRGLLGGTHAHPRLLVVQRQLDAGGTSTSWPHATTFTNGCTRRSNVSTLIRSEAAASSRRNA